MQRVDLCGTCAETMRESYSLKKVKGGVDNKITCACCKRRRYGSTYDVVPKKKAVSE